VPTLCIPVIAQASGSEGVNLTILPTDPRRFRSGPKRKLKTGKVELARVSLPTCLSLP
jgi:hypothetical protein